MAELVNANIASSLVRENVQGEPADLVFRRTDLINFLSSMGAVRPWTGGQPQQWNVVSAANASAEIFAEGAAAPPPGRQTYGRASLSPFYARVICGYSGHVVDQVNKGGVYASPTELEIGKGTVDLLKKFEDQLCGSVQDQGILSVIDAGDTYAGLAPGSVPAWASLETAVGGALTQAVLQDMLETLSLSPYLSAPTHLLAAHNQLTNYVDITGPGNATAANRLARYTPPAMAMGQGRYDSGMTPGGLNAGVIGFNGMDWIPVAGILNTSILMLDMTAGVTLDLFRDIQVKILASSNDDQSFQVSIAGALRVEKRNAHGRLTGVTP